MRKLASVLLALMLSISITACTGNTEGGLGTDDPNVKVVIKAWMPLEPWSIASFQNRDFGENEIIKEIEKKFNIDFQFTHPVTNNELDQFAFMTNEKTLPDLIFSPTWYAGGIEQGINDGIYQDLTSYIPTYMPSYNKIIKENEEIKKLVYTDSGKIGTINEVSLYEEYPYYGPIFKQKWLTDIGEEVPETIADWERVLKKFKDQKGATSAFLLDKTGYDYTAGTFLSAYGVAPAFYLDNTEVKYGPMENGFYDYLNLMRSWIKQGLINPSFAENDWNDILNKIKSQESGVLMQSPDTMSVEFENAGISWVHAPYPKLNKDDKITYRQKNYQASYGWMNSAAISTSCKNTSRLMKALDYGYSVEGSTLFNFGIKDRTYTEDEKGNKEFTDIIYNNQYGFSTTQTLWKYKVHSGLFTRDEHHANPILIKNKKSMAARSDWSKISTASVLPPVTYTTAENAVVSKNMTAVNKYLQTQVLAFLTGTTNDFSNTDVITDSTSFKNTMNAKGIDNVIKIVKDAYARYLLRG